MGHPVFGTTCSWYKGYHWELYSGAKRASRAPRVTKSTHTRKFGNHVTVHHLQPARPHHRHTNVYSHTFYLLWEPREPSRKLMAHQCCDQLTAVKTRHPLTSITWPYRGLRCRPIQVEYFFEVIRWQVTKFMLLFLKVSPCLLLLLSHIWALARSCWVISFFLHFSSSDWTSSPVSSFRRCIQQRDFRANSTCFLFHLPFRFLKGVSVSDSSHCNFEGGFFIFFKVLNNCFLYFCFLYGFLLSLEGGWLRTFPFTTKYHVP